MDEHAPAYAVCSAGKRWYWFAWPNSRTWYDAGSISGPALPDPPASGHAATKSQAEADALEAVGRLWPGRVPGRLPAKHADVYRRALGRQARPAPPSGAGPEFLWLAQRHYEDNGLHPPRRHRVVKKTARRVFVEKDHYFPERLSSWPSEVRALARLALERDGELPEEAGRVYREAVWLTRDAVDRRFPVAAALFGFGEEAELREGVEVSPTPLDGVPALDFTFSENLTNRSRERLGAGEPFVLAWRVGTGPDPGLGIRFGAAPSRTGATRAACRRSARGKWA
jgi:hypothetical protein